MGEPWPFFRCRCRSYAAQAAGKHGGEFQRVDIDRLDVAITTDDDQLLAVSEALDKLAERDPTGAELIKLRFFAGPGGQV